VVAEVESDLVERRGEEYKKNHMKAVGRAKKNRVTRLQRVDGHVTHQRKEMEDMTHDF
jgi:hypothetical protein